MALTTKFPRSLDEFSSRPQSDYVEGLSLAASTAERVPIPANSYAVIFSCTGSFCAKLGTATVTAAMPTDTTDGSASELNPSAFAIQSGQTHISVIASAAALMTLSFYLKP